MSRKTKLGTKSAGVPETQTFEGKAIPYQYLDEKAQIEKALVDDKTTTKERELLEKELEKPFNQRNKALINKYRGSATEVPNGWPVDTSSGGYEITATAFDDGDIPITSRPMPWFATVKIQANRNKWIFRFPLKKEPVSDGAEIYKIDGMPTWIFPNGDVVASMSDEETPYTILKGVIDGIDDTLNYHFDFPNFYVKYTKTAASSEKSVTKTAVKIQHVTYDPDNVELIEGDDVEAARLLKEVSKNGIDIGPVTPIKKERCRVTGVACGKARASNMWLYFDEVTGDKVITSTILSGSAVAARYLGLKRVTAAEISTVVVKNNAEVRKQA